MNSSLFKPIWIAGAIVLAGMAGCSHSEKNKSGPAMPGSPVKVAQALQKDVPLEILSIGRVEAVSKVSVKAQVGGEVTAVYFKEGQAVRKGDRLFAIDSQPFEIALKQAESVLEKDRALLRNAEADVARYTDLAQKDFVTKEQYDTLKANRDVLVAAVKADEASVAKARLDLGYTMITAPIDGRTGSLFIDPGNIITANDANPAVVIEQVTPIYVAFTVPEQNLPRVREFMAQGPLRTEAASAGSRQRPYSGVLTFIDNAIDPAAGTIMMKATFDNPDGAMWPGQFLNIRLFLTVEKGALVVPTRAVQTSQSGQYVFVVKDDMTAEMRPVQVDRTTGEESIIASGLKAGERVVTDGQLRLVPGARVEILPGS
jgi:multidrug efflux system membrane fusion protein